MCLVLKHREELALTGIVNVPELYPQPLPKAAACEVKDGSQPGIYVIDAAVNPAVGGTAYLKVFNVASGERLSEDRLTQRSVRHLGWSNGGVSFFR